MEGIPERKEEKQEKTPKPKNRKLLYGSLAAAITLGGINIIATKTAENTTEKLKEANESYDSTINKLNDLQQKIIEMKKLGGIKVITKSGEVKEISTPVDSTEIQ